VSVFSDSLSGNGAQAEAANLGDGTTFGMSQCAGFGSLYAFRGFRVGFRMRLAGFEFGRLLDLLPTPVRPYRMVISVSA
jgi:hypothetical protein